MLDFALVAEALQERGLLISKLAPHLVRPVPFIYPLHGRVLGARSTPAPASRSTTPWACSPATPAACPHHRHLTRRKALQIVPAMKKDSLIGALQYYDAQVDDARHTMFLARTAAAYGAHVASRARVVEFIKEGERVCGAVVQDLESGRTLRVLARQVVNSTGVWTDDTQALVGERGQFHVRASKGIHLVVPRDRIRSESGLILRTEKSVLFVIPWGRHWIVGTTDTDWSLDKAHPAASSQRHRLRARPRQRGAGDPAHPRGRRGRVRRPAAAARGRDRGRPRSCPASTPSPTPPPGWSWSPAASTRPTG